MQYHFQSCRFDERISSFAEQKFGRDGIEVQTGCRVVNVNDKEITVKIKSTGELHAVPHGLVVWSTGIATRPVVRDFMEQIGQVLLNSMHFYNIVFPLLLHFFCVCPVSDQMLFSGFLLVMLLFPWVKITINYYICNLHKLGLLCVQGKRNVLATDEGCE